jgi:ribosomal protein S18 acetylase RimI-like enzyme
VNLSRNDLPAGTTVFDLRPMTDADIPDALALWAGIPGLSLFPCDSPGGLSRYLNRNPGLSVVARANGQVVGAALAGHDARRGFLHHVAVVPACRRRGLGRTMVEWCLKALTAEGIGRSLILVNAGNEEAKAFWRHIGWEDRPNVHLMAVTTDPEKA